MATKEQYEKIFGKMTPEQWSQVEALHPAAAPTSTMPALAQLSITPHGDGVTAYRMGAMDRSIDAAKLARARAFYLPGENGALDAAGYGAHGPNAAMSAMANGQPIPVATKTVAVAPAPAAAPASAPTFAAPNNTTTVQDPGNLEPYVEPAPAAPVTYPVVKPVVVPGPAAKPVTGIVFGKTPVVTLAPQEDLDNPKPKKGKKKGEPAPAPSAFKMSPDGMPAGPGEGYIPPGKG